jgi:putative hydrolase of the HAD superfamily
VTIRAVTFDCWGTLLLDSPGSDERYREQRLAGMLTVLRRLGVDPGRRRLGEAYDMSLRRLASLWQTHRDAPVTQHVRAVLQAVDPRLPDRFAAADFVDLVDAYARPALLSPPRVDPGARGSLEWLADAGLALAVVSNTMRTPGDVLAEILERAGLPAFKVLTFSDACGIRKPDPRIFHLTLERLGVAPEQAVHVGDDPILDVEGALDAGMSVIQVTATGRATAPAKPHAVIRGLDAVKVAVERLAATRVA